MITIFQKDSATVITIENAGNQERKLIRQAEAILHGDGAEQKQGNVHWNKFKCNRGMNTEPTDEQTEADKQAMDAEKQRLIELIGSLEDTILICPLEDE